MRRLPGLAAVVAALLVLAIGAAVLARGDGDGRDSAATRDRATTSSSSSTSTTEATTTTSTSTTAAPGVAASASCPAVPARVGPPADRPRYNLEVVVKPDENAVDGLVSVRFTPDLPTDRLVFRLWPNGPRPARGGAKIAVATPVVVDGAAVQPSQPDPTTLVVQPAQALRAGQTVTVAMTWRLTLPGSVSDRISRTGEAIRLGSFFPILAWEPGRGWATEPPTTGFAEASVAASADFDTKITVPAGLSVLASGVQQGDRWIAEAAPDVAISIGRFRLASGTANAPHPVQVTVGVHDTLQDSADRYLAKSIKVLEDFSTRFGPYPWPTYTLALTPNLGGGIEYPMHVMQGPLTIGRTTSHEVAHMWFYGLVANNQGRHPWLDEGLATWAEHRYEGKSPAGVSIPAGGKGRAGEPMTFWESRQSIYYRSVYVQGAQAIGALGSAEQVDCALRHFVARAAYRVATPADLVAAFRPVFPNPETVLARYGIHP